MKRISIVKKVAAASATLIFGCSVASSFVPAMASAATAATNSTTSDATRLANIKAKGADEITRRLNALNTAAGKINGLTKLTADDKAYLSSEVSTEISGLISLQTKLAADTSLAQARSDAQSIISGYRVYVLVLPKVWLIKVADYQQVTEGNLTTFATKLQSRIDSAKSAGKDITQLQTQLNDMKTQTTNAQAISSSIEQKVLGLQPGDYNSDHTILSGDMDQLKTAHSDNQAAYNDAKSIVSELKSL